MSSIGSFGTFTTARLAIYVSQKGLSVTGNNIANINTVGYTRQRLDQVSFRTGGSDRYQNSADMHVGNGAIARSVSQLRDPYLDIRYRGEASSVGYYTGRLNGLADIATILDETVKGENDGDGLLYAQFKDFFTSLQYIQSDTNRVNDTLAYTSADALCKLFYNAANELEKQQINTETKLRQQLDTINSLLTNIRGLNESIRDAEIAGDNALELRDQRNNYIDELSEQLDIDVTYTTEDLGSGRQVEKLSIRLGNANPDKDVLSDSSLLVDGLYCAQLATPKLNDKLNGPYDPAYAIFDKESAAYQQALKDMRAGKEVADPRGPAGATFTDQTGLDAAIDTILADETTAFLPFEYLDINGAGTNDPRKAEQVFDDHYNIYVSDLRDKNYKPWKEYGETRTTKVLDTTGFPTRAKYSNTLTYSGMWKDGDKINVAANGKTVTVEVGKDVSAKAANEDPKNVSNAIREALVETLRDANGDSPYNISTTTSRTANGDANVLLNISAKEAGAGTVPAINITIDANNTPYSPGQITLGAPAADANKKNVWTADVAVAKEFERGDTIQVGGVTMVVGQDITLKAANDPARLASALASRMKLDGYKISSTSDKDGAKLVFTATDTANPQAPAALTATVTAPKDATLTAGAGTNIPGTPPGNDKNGNPVNLYPDPITQENGDNTTGTEVIGYYQDENDNWFRSSKITSTSQTKMLDDNDLFGELQATREILTEEGEFASVADVGIDENAAIKRGIPYYRQALDLLARKFAQTMNEANNGFAVDEKGNYLKPDGTTVDDLLAGAPVNRDTGLTQAQAQELIDAGCVKADGTADLDRWLEAKGAEKMGGNLFSNRGDTDDDTGITAMNISVSKKWSDGLVHVVPTYTKLFGGETGNTTQQDNALHMSHLIDADMIFNPQDLIGDAVSDRMFEGSFQEMFEQMNVTLGNDRSSTDLFLNTHYGQALDIDTSRDSVSAVDLNDEAMDLMQYTHSLNAAYRLMTTLDEMLERLITGTGVTR